MVQLKSVFDSKLEILRSARLVFISKDWTIKNLGVLIYLSSNSGPCLVDFIPPNLDFELDFCNLLTLQDFSDLHDLHNLHDLHDLYAFLLVLYPLAPMRLQRQYNFKQLYKCDIQGSFPVEDFRCACKVIIY